jgi:predicted PurR-regulated permease PerM
MKIHNPFRLGLLAGLGVLLALVIGHAVADLTTILTYVGAAIFLALGLDPLVSWLEKHRIPRPVAIVITLVGVLGIFAGLIFALIPVITEQVTNLTKLITNTVIPGIQDNSLVTSISDALPWLQVDTVLESVGDFFADPTNIGSIGGGVLAAGISLATGLFGGVIILILMVYFIASLGSLKRGIYQLVPASKRHGFISLAEQISQSVGRYVMGQVTLALVNGVLTFVVLSLLGIRYVALLAFIAFLGSLIPLVGTVSASVLITLGALLFTGAGWQVVVVGVYYIVYMQVEAYVLSPRIMNRAVKVPGVVVVIAALVGGTLLGVLGALIAIPVAAAIQLILKEVVVPRQNAL